MRSLAGNAHCEILPVISECFSMWDEHCKRSIKFTNGCVVSECCLRCVGSPGLPCQMAERTQIRVEMQFSFQIWHGLDTCEVKLGILK